MSRFITDRFKRFFIEPTEERKIKKGNTYTYQPSEAFRLGGKMVTFTVEDKAQIETDVYSSITSGLSAFETLHANIETYFAAYGQEHIDAGETPDGSTNFPWPNASDITVPTICSETDALTSYIVGSAFVPRTVVVTANTKEAAQYAPTVENFYNAELKRMRSDGKSWMQHLLTCPQLGLIQGVAPVDIRVHEYTKIEAARTPRVAVDESGMMQVDDTGVVAETVEQETKHKLREVLIKPRYLRDLLYFPANARETSECVAFAYAEFLYEQQLLEMVRSKGNPDGFLDADAVQYIISLYPTGSSFESDRQGSWDKTLNSQVSIGDFRGAPTSRFFRNRGPFKVWYYLTNEYDFKGDGSTQWYWIFMFDDAPTYLGVAPFEYFVRRAPSAFYTPLPRPNRIVGFSIAERLMDLTGEISSIVNDINNYLAQIVNPTGIQDANAIDEDEGEYVAYPGRVNLVRLPPGRSVNDVFSWFRPPPLPQEIVQFVAYLEKWVSKVTGQNAPMLGAQGPGRRTATEQRMQAQATATRTGLSVLNFRFFLREVINYVHELYKQYPPGNGEAYNFTHNGKEFTLDPKVLALDYTIDIAGISDPNDIGTKRQELIMVCGLIMKFPEVMGNAVHRRNLLHKIMEAWQWMDADDISGTVEEAKALQQQEAQQQEKAAREQQGEQLKQMLGGEG